MVGHRSLSFFSRVPPPAFPASPDKPMIYYCRVGTQAKPVVLKFATKCRASHHISWCSFSLRCGWRVRERGGGGSGIATKFRPSCLTIISAFPPTIPRCLSPSFLGLAINLIVPSSSASFLCVELKKKKGFVDRCARRRRGDGGDAADSAVGERVRGHLVRCRGTDARRIRPRPRRLRVRPLQHLQQARAGEEEGAMRVHLFSLSFCFIFYRSFFGSLVFGGIGRPGAETVVVVGGA